MSQKRKDNKGRILRNGESQRKDGRYAYKYTGLDGKDRFMYSWKLEKTDRLPAGKRDGLSLREKEKQIQRDLDDGIIGGAEKLTVAKLVKRHLELKKSLKCRSVETYRSVYRLILKEDFGNQKIDKIKKSDAKKWILKLYDDGRSYEYLTLIKSVLCHAFQVAVDDMIIRNNPFDFRLRVVVKDNTKLKESLTESEEIKFLNFVHESSRYKKYYEAVYILFNTGLRISELAGLTIEDVDFKNNVINIDHQILKKHSGEYYIETPKTKHGYRKIPMTSEVASCFRSAIANRHSPDIETTIGDKTGFIFLDRCHKPTVALHWYHRFVHMCEYYNEVNEDRPIKITPHICRHTFCSKMANAGMNPKALQYLMGHADISVTLNVYTHIDENNVQIEFDRIIKKALAA